MNINFLFPKYFMLSLFGYYSQQQFGLSQFLKHNCQEWQELEPDPLDSNPGSIMDEWCVLGWIIDLTSLGGGSSVQYG